MPKRKLITARASVNLPGLAAGATAQVDPTDNRVAGLLRTGLLVDEEATLDEPEAAEEPVPTITSRRAAEKPQEQRETSGDAAPPSPTARPRGSSTASQSTTD